MCALQKRRDGFGREPVYSRTSAKPGPTRPCSCDRAFGNGMPRARGERATAKMPFSCLSSDSRGEVAFSKRVVPEGGLIRSKFKGRSSLTWRPTRRRTFGAWGRGRRASVVGRLGRLSVFVGVACGMSLFFGVQAPMTEVRKPERQLWPAQVHTVPPTAAAGSAFPAATGRQSMPPRIY